MYKFFLINQCLLSLALCFSAALSAQNIVSNGSLETNSGCPSGFGQLSNANGWFSPTDGNPDYFDACVAGSGTVGVPANLFGDQAAADGNSYAGFYAYGPNNLREYVSTQLSQDMLPGEQYCISFKVSRADFTYQAVADIGAYFSTTAINTINGSQHLGLTPQVSNANGVITDDQDWVTINGIYTATDTMRYITIGNFNSNNNTNVQPIAYVPGVSGPFINQGYYYLDDLKVTRLAPLAISVPPFNSTLLCQGESATLVASGLGDTYSWATAADPFTVLGNNDTLVVNPSLSTSYIVTVKNGDCDRTDTLDITVLPQPQVDFTASSACIGQPLYLTDASTNVSAGASYQWDFDNDGITDAVTGGGATAVFNTAGTYEVRLTVINNATCTATTVRTVVISANCDPCSQNTNLAPNPSFEAFDSCPDDLGQLSRVIAWYQPTDGTTDYFQACANGTNAGIPLNQLGMQAAASGNAYTGFHAYGPFNYREYVSTTLDQALVAGKTYCISFKVSMGDNTRKAVDQIGAYFSVAPVSSPTQSALNLVPQISNTNGVITDKTNWTTIKGTFVANAAMQYVTIGNFYENSATSVINVSGSTPQFANFGYYYLDDVSVVEIPDLFVPTDTLVACAGTNLQVPANGDFCTFAWFDQNNTLLSNNDTLSISSTATGIQAYHLTATLDADCGITKTVYINWIPVPTASATVQANCAGGITAFIDQSQNVLAGATYAWDFNNDTIVDATGAGSQLYIYNTPGIYAASLTVTNPNGCADTYLFPVAITANCDPCTDENNLVSNGDFEAISNCPNALGQYDQLSNWLYYDANNGTPDLFAACATTPAAATPNNQYGSQAPYNGNNYVGFMPIAPTDTTQKQYLVGQVFPLTVGQQYCVRLQVSLADSARFATDQIGMALFNGGFTPNINPQLNNTEFSIITQSNGWVELAATFVADAAYSNVAIGNFMQYDANIALQNATNPLNRPYYYVDGVSITALNLSLPEDLSICAGDTATITAQTNTCDAFWTVAATGQLVGTNPTLVVSPTQTTTYLFTGTNGTCGISDSITVVVKPLPTIILADTVAICAGSSIQLSAATNAASPSYTWLPNNNIVGADTANPTVSPNTTTTYFVTIVDNASTCSHTDSVTVVVNRLPIAGISSNVTICSNASTQLYAEGGVSYAWSPADSLSATNIPDPIANPANTTTYTVTVSSAEACTATQSVTVTVQPPYADSSSSIDICGDAAQALNPIVPTTAVSFQWYPIADLSNANIANPITTTPNDLIYTLYYTDSLGCAGQSQVSVSVNPRPFAGVDVQICDGGSVQLNASSGGDSYSWSPAAGLSDANIANPIANPNATTDYVLTVAYNTPSGLCTLSDTVQVQVASTGFANAGNDQTICQGSSANLNAIGGDTYSWTPAATLNDPNIANPVATPSTTTDYILTTSNNTTGCTSVDTVTVAVVAAQTPILGAVSLTTCQSPYTAIPICVGLNYAGCESLVTSINGQLSGLSSAPFYTDTTVCFFYLTTFYDNGNTVRADTLTIDVCTAVNGLCATTTAVLNYCDQAPMWSTDALDATTCQGQAVAIALPSATDPDTDEGSLTYTATSAANGTVSLSNGVASYTPNSGFVGSDAFDVLVCDQLQPVQCDTLTINIGVQANQAPVAPSQSLTTPYNTPIDVCTGISDPDGDPLSLTGSGNGLVAITGSAAGAYCIRLVPTSGFVGTTVLSYTVCDPCGRCTNGFITLTVLPPVNQPPVVTPTNITTTTPYETPVTVCLNVSDPNGDDIVYDLSFAPLNGNVVFDVSANCIVYTPNSGFVGTDAVQFNVCDENGACVPVTVIVNVLPPLGGVAPVLNDVSATTPFNTAVEVCLDAEEPQNEPVSYQFSNPTNGSIAQTDSCIVYTPANGFVGNDTISVIACDPSLNCDTAVIIITVQADNPAPTASDLSLTTNANTAVIGCFDISNQPASEAISVTLQNDAVNGSVSLQANSCFTYTPNADFVGNDQFVIQVCDAAGQCTTATGVITVLAINTPPSVADVTVSGTVNTPVDACFTITNQPAGEAVSINIAPPPANGTVTIDTNGCFVYTPNTGFTGTDSFGIQVCDAAGQCTFASASITINANNPIPTINDLSATTPNHTPISGCFMYGNQPTGEALTFNIVTPPANGTATIDANGCYVYTPNGTFAGTDVFTVQICDALGQCATANASITVNPNTPPLFNPIPTTFMVSGNDTTVCFSGFNDAQGDSVVLTITIIELVNGGPASDVGTAQVVMVGNSYCIDYNSVAGFSGLIRVVVSVCDDQVPPACLSTNVVFNINNIPTAPNISATTPQATPVTGCFAVTDIDGDDYTVTIVTPPANGTATIDAAGCVTYTPTGTYVGSDVITVQICDENNLCSTATYTVTVTDGIIAVDNAFATEEGITRSYDVLGNDTAPAATVVTVIDAPANGVASVNAQGEIVYTANAGFVGTDTLTYTICNALLGCDTAIVVFTVSNALQADNDFVSTTQNTGVDIAVLTNDSTPGAPTITILNGVDNGLFVDNGNGNYTYLPNPSFTGVDSFVYVISYPNYGSDTATVYINVAGNPPTANAVDDAATTPQDTPVSIVITNNDQIPAGSYVVSIATQPANGTLSFNPATGTVTYTPNSGFSGTDSFTYTICHSVITTICDQASVTITVTPTVDCTVKVYKVITPNGDNRNDYLKIDGLDCNGNNVNTLQVFNRWGNLVFEADNYGAASFWDGTYGGSPVPDGTYFYILKVPSANVDEQGYIEIQK